MKKQGMLNRDLAAILASMGHTDTLVIADCGLPIPTGVRCVDLSVAYGLPSFEQVLKAVLDDFICEAAIVAEPIMTDNQPCWLVVHALLNGTPIQPITHDAFKVATAAAKVVIRTGEATPYANIILRSGVSFPPRLAV